MKEIVSEPNLVAYCGLYCGACRAYLKERCPGCHENSKAKWCKIRSCCVEHEYHSCAACEEFADPTECKKFNNIVARLFAFFLCSDRTACIQQIRRLGIQGHADDMAKRKRQTISK